MSEVAICPRCDGGRTIVTEQGETKSCPTCSGSGVVWRITEAEAQDGKGDPTELRGL